MTGCRNSLVGVMARGTSNCAADPSVYTKITEKSKKWIMQNAPGTVDNKCKGDW